MVGPSLRILGGQAVQLQRLLKRFEGDPDIQVGFLPVNPVLPGVLSGLQRIRYVRTIVTTIAYVASLFRNVRQCDVVHAFSASYWSFMLAPLPAMIVARLYGKAVVLNYRSGEARDHLERWRWIAVPAMRLASTIVVPSAYLVEVFDTFGLKAEAISNFVDVERVPYRKRTTLCPVFLSNRNLQPLYNVACILRAFARIKEQVPEAKLIVAGFGPERESLERLARTLGLSDVDFRGRLSPEKMIELYDEADIYLNSPNIDNMPTSIIEAFAAGLPVVTTNAGGIPFIVTHEVNGLVVECGDDAAMADASLRLLREQLLGERLASRARDECTSRYVWSAIREAWSQTYMRVLTA